MQEIQVLSLLYHYPLIAAIDVQLGIYDVSVLYWGTSNRLYQPRKQLTQLFHAVPERSYDYIVIDQRHIHSKENERIRQIKNDSIFPRFVRHHHQWQYFEMYRILRLQNMLYLVYTNNLHKHTSYLLLKFGVHHSHRIS